jgi:hypothetical protein
VIGEEIMSDIDIGIDEDGPRHDISRDGPPPYCCHCGKMIASDVAMVCIVCDKLTGPCCITEIGSIVEACHEHEAIAVNRVITRQREKINALRDRIDRLNRIAYTYAKDQ